MLSFWIILVSVTFTSCLTEATPVYQNNVTDSPTLTNVEPSDTIPTANPPLPTDPDKSYLTFPTNPRVASIQMDNVTPWTTQSGRGVSTTPSSQSDRFSLNSGATSTTGRDELPMTAILVKGIQEGPITTDNTVIIPVPFHESESPESHPLFPFPPIPDTEKGWISSIDAKKCDLKKLLRDEATLPLSLASFRQFCESVMLSPELLSFYESVEKYKSHWESQDLDSQERQEMYDWMIREYIQPGSEKEINLPVSISKRLLKSQQATWSVFDEAQEHVYEMMRTNALPRYVATFRRNVSCPSKSPPAAMLVLATAAFLPHFLYQIVTGSPQIDRLQLLPAFMSIILASISLQQRFCVMIWMSQMMQQVNAPALGQKLLWLRIKDPVVSKLQSQFLLGVLFRGIMLSLLMAPLVLLFPSYPISDYRLY